MDSQNKGGGVLTKKCSKCLKRRALSSFRKDPRYRLGVFCWCNKCVAEKALERFHKNRDVLNERQRRYRRENADHERRREQDYRRRTGRSGVSYSNEKYQAIKERAGHKLAARRAVQYQVGRGNMPKANELKCTDCPSDAAFYDHFLGYEKQFRLSVQPVCIKCSVKRSAERGEIEVVAPIK